MTYFLFYFLPNTSLVAYLEARWHCVQSLELFQMFLNFSDKSELNVSEEPEPEMEPEPEPYRRNSAQLDSVTSL